HIYWIRVKELEASTPKFNNEFSDNSSSDEESIDGEVNDFDKDKNKDKEESKGDDPTYPPGFTPNVVEDNVGENMADSINQPNGNLHSNKDSISSVKSGSNRSLKLKLGGSILEVMEDLVEVGQTMGYNMEGCLKK
ncbi:hypothetical protein Tco_1564700, partial [Tanacetum coccineum]